MTKQLTLGLIGFIWGGAILINHFLLSSPTGNADYDAGSSAAMIFGAAIFGAGIRALYFWNRERV